MSPAATQTPFQTTVISTHAKSILQNSNAADCTGYASGNHPKAPQPAASCSTPLSSNFKNGGEFNLGSGFAAPNGSRRGAAASGRSRPRQVNLRKQLHRMTGNGSGDCWSDFNPFKQFNQASSLVSTVACDASSDNHVPVSDGFTEACENTIDGARHFRSDREFVTDNGVQNTAKTQNHSETSIADQKSRLGHDYKETETEVRNYNNPIKCQYAVNNSESNLKPELVLGRNQVCSMSKSDCNQSESSVYAGSTSFVFGESWFRSSADLKVEGRGSTDFIGQSVSNYLRQNVEDEAKSQFQNVDSTLKNKNKTDDTFRCSLNSVIGLQNDMQKLDITGSRNTSDPEATMYFQRKANSSDEFLFHINNKNSIPLKPDQKSVPQDLMSQHAPAAVGITASSQFPKKDDVELSGTAPQSFSHHGFGSKQNGVSPKCPDAVGFGINKANGDPSSPTGVSPCDFKTFQWDPSSFKENLFPEADMKMKFGAKGAFGKDKRSKKTKGKLKQFGMRKQLPKQEMARKEVALHENTSSSECCSPMDFSPYIEDVAPDKSSCETYVNTYEATCVDKNFVAPAFNPSICFSARVDNPGTEPMMSHHKSMGLKENGYGHDSKGFFVGDSSSNCFVHQAERAHSCFNSCFKCEEACDNITSESANHSEAVVQENALARELCFATDMRNGRNFVFSASPSSVLKEKENINMRNRRLRKKSGTKPGKVIGQRPEITMKFSTGESSIFSITPSNDLAGKEKKNAQQNKNVSDPEEQFKQGPDFSTAALKEFCDMWRLRGNQAYRNGNLTRAEDFYTNGINSVPENVASGCSMMPLVLCYSNRAATRISLEKLREALSDCLVAAALDSTFFKVYLRAANCHLVLGETENAITYFSKCLGSTADVCLDRRVTIDAADGLQKAKNLDELARYSAQLLEMKTSDAASSALDHINQALTTSSRSEKLFRMKVEALIMLRKYEEAIRLCEKTLNFAEKNVSELDARKQFGNVDFSQEYSSAKIWRFHLMSKSYFYMGKLELALDLLDQLEQVGSLKENKEILESSISLAVIIRELLRRKNAGNAAFRSARYTEAVEHYTVALSSNVESRPFAAVCFCNRAAAYQALGQIADAIADCSMAMALDGTYMKAVSRRAALHEIVRDYRQATNDLQRVIALLENQGDENAQQLGTPGSAGKGNELKQAHQKVSKMHEAAKKGLPLDLYVILGVKPSDGISDIKKAYRKAALKHHPDKAGQFIARSESGYEWQLWKEIAEDVHKDADRLFKVIGESYAVLSDPTKREEYDIEEEIRKASKESESKSFRKTSSPYQETTGRRSWHGNRRPNGSSYSQW